MHEASPTSPIQRYQQADLASVGPEKMIVLLYEALDRHLQQAQTALTEQNRLARTRSLDAAQAIIIELRNALDHDLGGQISRNLEALYDYMFNENLSSLVDNDPDHLRNVRNVIKPLLEAWRKIPAGSVRRIAERTLQNRGSNEDSAVDLANELSRSRSLRTLDASV